MTDPSGLSLLSPRLPADNGPRAQWGAVSVRAAQARGQVFPWDLSPGRLLLGRRAAPFGLAATTEQVERPRLRTSGPLPSHLDPAPSEAEPL
jgi:hypothetical protein